MMRGCALLCLVCVAAPAQQPPVFKSETEIVLVDAVVTNKKGEYVRDLAAKDFRVFADGKEQPIRSFSLEPASDSLRLILFFDNSSLNVTDQVNARNAAASFVDSILANASGPSSRLIAVLTFDGGFRVAQNFTADATKLKNAIRNGPLATPSPTGRYAPPSSTTSALPSLFNLARSLNAAPGRKDLVLFAGAGGFAAAQSSDIAELVQIMNRARTAVYPVLQPQAVLPSPDAVAAPMGIRGAGRPAPGADPGAQDGAPYTLASGTGGFVIPFSNDPLPQLRKVGEELGQTYVLGFSPPASDKPEACHSLRVKVDVSGTSLLARSSYCASKPQDLLAESRVEQDLEKRAAAPEAGTTAIQTPFFYLSPNVARVHAVMEIPTETLKFEAVKGKQHAEINVLGVASSANGTAARFSDIVKRDFETQRDAGAFRSGPLRYEKEFKIVPGEYKLTVVFSSGGASFGKAETTLAIPAREPEKLALSGLALGTELRAAGDLGLESSLLDQGTALVAGGMQLIPAGTNSFSKPEKIYCYFEVYPPQGAATASLRARIADRKTESVKWDAGEAKLDNSSGRAVLPMAFAVPVESLAPGSYELEITVTDSSGSSVERVASFTMR